MSQQDVSLYPPLLPNEEHHVKVSELHQIYFATYGNPDGIPVITLHGGPGSGSTSYFAQFFDPTQYHIIVADQRGAGRSLPKGEMVENTTQHLIADIEIIREFLKLKKWVIFGGSWGSTLALLYAEAHPERVLGLILRGIFLARRQDLSVFTREGCPAALLNNNAWQEFKQMTQTFMHQANLGELTVESDIYQIYYQLLTQPHQPLAVLAAGTLAAWEKRNSFLRIDPEELQWSHSADGVNMGRTEAFYFEHQCFIRPNQILDEISKLKNLPVYIIQGQYDLICPPYQADELETALRQINTQADLITRYDVLAGHSHKEEAIRSALVEASIHLRHRL